MDHQHLGDATAHCCAECGKEGDATLKVCKSCMVAKYCNANCQRNHWPTHKIECKERAAKQRNEALFKDPPAKEDCLICFLPMPSLLISCMTLSPATITSVPIFDCAEANEELAGMSTEVFYECCGKSICKGCAHSFCESGNSSGKCPFCNERSIGKTDEETVEEIMKRVEANDAGAIYVMGKNYYHGQYGLQQDQGKALELYARAAALGSSQAHFHLGNEYREGGDSKKSKFHYEAAAMAGNKVARYNLGSMEAQSGNMERAVKHWMIAASAGDYNAMHNLLGAFNQGLTSRESINSTLTTYNNSCAEMRSEARDAYIRVHSDHAGER